LAEDAAAPKVAQAYRPLVAGSRLGLYALWRFYCSEAIDRAPRRAARFIDRGPPVVRRAET